MDLTSKISGGYSYGETPVPIPNTEVKSIALIILAWLRAGNVSTARLKKPRLIIEAFFYAYFFYFSIIFL